jgi:hypothetical protein
MSKTNGTNGRAKKNGTASTARKKAGKGIINEKMKGQQWKPGQSGNPGGRSKGSISLTRILRERLKAGDGEKAGEIVASAINKAIEGDARHLQQIWERVDGKVADRLAGHDGGPLIRQVTFDVDRM